MFRLALLASILVSTALSLDEVPHASAIKSVGKANVRRAPMTKPAEGLSLVPHAHRMSTGVRRAPSEASQRVTSPSGTNPYKPTLVKPQKMVKPKPQAPSPPVMIPMQMPVLPLLPQLPLLQPQPHPQLVRQQQQAQPQTVRQQRPQVMQPIPTLSPAAFTLPTVTFPPFSMPTMQTLIPIPTMPAMTMPPSFQRLLGMTTTTPEPERRSFREEKQFDDERSIKTKKSRGLSSVSSRLPKFVDNDEDVVSPEKNAEWIVPF